jgi:tetratricopeptide (TPR) repeat protein
MKTNYLILSIILGFLSIGLQAQNIEAGIRQMENENYREARKIFADLIAKDNKDAQAYFYMGQSFLDVDNIDSARHYFNLGVENNSRAALNYVGQGKIEYNNNKKVEARELFERAERLGKGKDWRVLYEIGRLYLLAEDKNLDIAIEKLEAAKDLARTNVEVWSTLGDAYLARNDGGKAASAYDYVLDNLKVQSAQVYQKKALLFKRSRTYDESEKNLETAIKLDPKFAPAYRDLIEVYQLTKKYSKITPLLRTYTELVGDDIEMRIRLVGFLFGQAKDYDATIAEADKVLATQPNNAGMHRWKGYAQIEKEQYAEGLATMEKFFANIGEGKTYFMDYDYYARAAVKTGDMAGAAAKYRKALELGMAEDDVYDKIAKMYYENKKWPEAVEAYRQKMQKVTPTSTDHFAVGYSLYQMQQYAAADSSFALVTEVLPDWLPGFVYRAKTNEFLDPKQDSLLAKPFHERIIVLGEADKKKFGTDLINAYRYLGYAEMKIDKFAEAKVYLIKLVEVAEMDPEKFKNSLKEAYSSLGFIYLEEKDKQKSREYYMKVLEIDPADETAKKALEYINHN